MLGDESEAVVEEVSEEVAEESRVYQGAKRDALYGCFKDSPRVLTR